MLFSVAVICYYLVHTVYMHDLFSLHTHSPGRVLTTLDLHVQILDDCFYCAVVRWDGMLCEELISLSLLSCYSYISLFLLLLFDSCISPLASILFLISFEIMCSLICIIAVIADYYSSDLYLVQVNLGLACIRGVFTSRIYVADSRRDFVSTYFGKRGVTNTIGLRSPFAKLTQRIGWRGKRVGFWL